jgi:hypothetical protein
MTHNRNNKEHENTKIILQSNSGRFAGYISYSTSRRYGHGRLHDGLHNFNNQWPLRGAAFTDPVTMSNISTTPGIVEVNLEAKIAPININGATVNLMTYNGTYPAST